MRKFDIVRWTDEERQTCLAVAKKLKGTSQKVRRANILLPHLQIVDEDNLSDELLFICNSSPKDSTSHSMQKNVKRRHDKNYWTENRKHKLLRYDYPIRRKDGTHGRSKNC